MTQLLSDFDEGRLTRSIGDRNALHELMNQRGIAAVRWGGWRAIDAAERTRGAAESRPRAKLVTVGEMLAAADVQPPRP